MKKKKLRSSTRERPTWDEYYKKIVIATKERSPCERLQVGCLFTERQSNNKPGL